MFATPAYAQTAGAPDTTAGLIQMLGLPVILIVLFYFLMIRPQQKRAKEHQAMLSAIKRGDTIVMSNGMIGKVTRVEEREVGVEIAQGVTVKVVKGMISEVRSKGDPAPANDPKS